MRVLLLFRGAPGCGKSTLIEKNGLKPFALCADDIRMMYGSPTLQVDGTMGITQDNDKQVWNALFRILETRMQNGEFTVIDATNSKTAEMKRYKDLANNYRYRIYCIDMTDIPIEEVKRRNNEREELKRVPEEVIDKMYSRFETQQIPAGIKVLKPDELNSIWYNLMHISTDKYTKIHVIGDIHGCYTALNNYLEMNGGFKEDELFIFCGDYIDRGIENAEVVKLLCEQCKYPNVILLEGNHERWLWMWANDLTSHSKEFEFVTKPQLEKAGVSKKDVRELYRRLGQCCYFEYNGNIYLVTHGGISNIPYRKSIDKMDMTMEYNLIEIPTYQMIKGVGKYEDADAVDISFLCNTFKNTYQIHGHRNVTNSPIQTTTRTFNLEGQVEMGGHLRAIQITKDGIATVEIKNDVFKKPEEKIEDIQKQATVNMSVYEMVENMRRNRYIFEKKFGRVSSFNFSKQAFERGIWDDMTNKARGMFIDNIDYKIVARSYDKFFNINERPETQLANLRYKLQFPVTAYVKENGFLGIVGWNPETDDLLITSKSSPISDFSGYFKDNLLAIYGEKTLKMLRQYIKDQNVSFVFECCDMEHDPHIIEYPKTKIVLLDIVRNKTEFDKIPYNTLLAIAEPFGFEVKEKAYVLESWEDFFAWYHEVNAEDYKYNNQYIEGFVVEDSSGYMVKMKLHYYKFWKRLRGVAQSVIKHGHYKYMGSLLTPFENEFFGWCKNLYQTLSSDERRDLADKSYTNIVHLRKIFLEYKEAHDREVQNV